MFICARISVAQIYYPVYYQNEKKLTKLRMATETLAKKLFNPPVAMPPPNDSKSVTDALEREDVPASILLLIDTSVSVSVVFPVDELVPTLTLIDSPAFNSFLTVSDCFTPFTSVSTFMSTVPFPPSIFTELCDDALEFPVVTLPPLPVEFPPEFADELVVLLIEPPFETVTELTLAALPSDEFEVETLGIDIEGIGRSSAETKSGAARMTARTVKVR